MKFFSDCKNKEEAKEVFRKLAKLFHPDHSGDDKLMIELKRQYDAFSPETNASYNGYEFNKINYSRNIPFDLPIQLVIRDLKEKIIILESEKRRDRWQNEILMTRIQEYQSAMNSYKAQLEDTYKILKDKTDLIDRYKLELEHIKSFIDSKPPITPSFILGFAAAFIFDIALQLVVRFIYA